MSGHSIEGYAAPLFLAWQLSNSCGARCLACCEESGPGKAWGDELTREQALGLAREIVAAGIPYVAFGGGEPLGVSHVWELFEVLTAGGVSLKLETAGQHLDDRGADRLVALSPQCVQISVDGAIAATHERARPGSSFQAAVGAIERLRARGHAPQLVFTPTRLNIHESCAAYDLAASLGCQSFVTGPLMRIGRAAAAWRTLACSPEEWSRTVTLLRQHVAGAGRETLLSIYPWDIVTEIELRLESPQAMLLVVPNGKVKLLNALPFSPADLRHDSLAWAWDAYRDAWRSSRVRKFVAACTEDPTLLRYANETWQL